MSRLLLVVVALVFLAETGTAQLNRRSRDLPEMSLDAGGRTGTCDFIGFSADGNSLYVAGDDKVVYKWPVGADGFKRGAEKLRWPGWRDQRGGIKTLALPRDRLDKRIVVAGYGIKNGLVVLLDGKGEIDAVNEVPGRDLPPANVMASAFAPDGLSVVYGTAEGKIWYWDFKANYQRIGKHEEIKDGEKLLPNRPRLIRFLDGDTFVSACESGEVLKFTRVGKEWKQVKLFSAVERLNADLTAKGKPAKTDVSIYRADLSVDGKWLACSLQPKFLVLCPLDGGAANVIEVDHFVRSLAFDKTGRLAVASSAHNAQKHDGHHYLVESNDSILIFANPLVANAKPEMTLKHTFRAEAMAWNNENGLLAVAGGDNHEVTLWNPSKSKDPIQVVRGRGRGLWGVRIAEDGKSIQFQSERDANSANPNVRGQGEWHSFNIVSGARADATDAAKNLNEADGWSIEPSKNNVWVWEAVLKGQRGELARHRLQIDIDRDEQPRCFTFLPKSKTQPNTRVLVGHYHGYTVFELTPEAATPITLATGHSGDVTSMAVDATRTWAITCGLDQTIAGWSLKPLPNGRFGAELKVEGDKLMVKNVDIGGPAWEMGLSKDDEIIFLVRDNQVPPIYALPGQFGQDRTVPYPVEKQIGEPNDALAALTDPKSGVEHYLAWRKPGIKQHIEGLSTLRQRPLWKFFPTFDPSGQFDQWVSWIWSTGHYATSTHGDRLVGWQLNDPDTIYRKAPTFYEATLFEKYRHRRVPVLRLMLNRDFSEAYEQLVSNDPDAWSLGKLEPDRVQMNVSNAVVGKDGLDLGIRVAARGTNPDRLPKQVELWVNDYKYKTWPANQKTFSTAEAIPESVFRNGENQVTVLTFTGGGVRNEVKTVVTSNRKEEPPRVLALLVGINDYTLTAAKADGTREFGPLKSARNDAEKLSERWQAHAGAGRFYSKDQLVLRVDRNAEPEQILKELDTLVREARTDDRVVVFLAGHGDFRPIVGAPKGSDDMTFVYCGPKYDQLNYNKTGLTGDKIFEKLAACPARKLVLIDACHSGNATSEGVIRRLVPSGQGPVVIAACDQAEKSYEDPNIGHGLFTKAILEALGEQITAADVTSDGQLDPKELFDYVTGRLPRLLKASGKSAMSQHPQMFPLEVGRFAIAQK